MNRTLLSVAVALTIFSMVIMENSFLGLNEDSNAEPLSETLVQLVPGGIEVTLASVASAPLGSREVVANGLSLDVAVESDLLFEMRVICAPTTTEASVHNGWLASNCTR